jgi:hypothetical protein
VAIEQACDPLFGKNRSRLQFAYEGNDARPVSWGLQGFLVYRNEAKVS